MARALLRGEGNTSAIIAAPDLLVDLSFYWHDAESFRHDSPHFFANRDFYARNCSIALVDSTGVRRTHDQHNGFAGCKNSRSTGSRFGSLLMLFRFPRTHHARLLSPCFSSPPFLQPRPSLRCGGTFTFARAAGPCIYLDPVHTAQNADIWISLNLYDTLIQPTVDGKGLQPGLAESYALADDGKSVSLKLASGLISGWLGARAERRQMVARPRAQQGQRRRIRLPARVDRQHRDAGTSTR